MIATSNFVNQMHNGGGGGGGSTTAVNNSNNSVVENSNLNNNNNNKINSHINKDLITGEQQSHQKSDYSCQQEDANTNNSASVCMNNNNNLNNNNIDNNNSIEQHNNNNLHEKNSEDQTLETAVTDDDQQQQNNAEESVDITISNVVSNFSVRCHLNLRQIATTGSNVVYKREQSIILMKLRQPNVTASIWSSGKITCTGATTEESAKCASRKVARCLQKLGFRVKFSGYRIVNVLGACHLPFGIKIHEFSDLNRPNASYEPELHPGVTYKIKDLKAVLKIFQTGSMTITAPSIRNVQLAVETIYPLVYEFRKPKPRT